MYNIFYNFLGLNKAAFIYVNNITNVSILPYVLKAVSQIFFIGNFPIYYSLLCLYFYIRLRFYQSNLSSHNNKENTFILVYNQIIKLGLCYTLFGFLYAGLKFSINLPRPFCSLPNELFSTIIDISNERCLSSFPSAHMGLAIIISNYLWPYLKFYQRLILICTLILVALSRISLAMHYPTDILYSIIIAMCLTKLTEHIFNLIYKIVIKPTGIKIYRLTLR